MVALRGRGWELAPCLVVLEDEINARYPKRSKRSDGSVASAAHSKQNPTSDHEADRGDGLVKALDLTDDPPRFDPDDFLELVVARRDPRVKYAISDMRIVRSYPTRTVPAWTWSRRRGWPEMVGEAFGLPLAVSGGSGSAWERVHVVDVKAAGTSGGTFTQEGWQTRTLNTVYANDVTGASLSSNELTLPAGTYDIDASCPAFRVNFHQARLYDVTSASTLLPGSPSYQGTTDGSTLSTVRGRIVLAGTTVVRLEHYCTSTKTTDGFGFATAGPGISVVYASLVATKVA